MAIPKAIRKSLLEDLQEVIRKTQEQIQPQEQTELGNEKLERFHRENPYRYQVAEAIYKRFRDRQKKYKSGCFHVKGLQPILLEALGYEIPPPTKEDYNIGYHILPDGTEKIWCLKCGQHFTRKEAKNMLEQSSNRTSTSERLIPINTREEQEPKAVYFDPFSAYIRA